MSRLILVRGAGDVATGTIHRLCRCGFQVVALESEKPSAIRRAVSFSEAVYDGSAQVEGITARLIESWQEARGVLEKGEVPLLVDEDCSCISKLKPAAVLDAVIAKRNLGTNRDMAPITIGYGPGFTAGEDVDVVIETLRGHDLGRILYKGSAVPDTRTPGNIEGYTNERVIHAPQAGMLAAIRRIGDFVEKDEPIAFVGDTQVRSKFGGLLRGILRDGYQVKKGMKMADVDPRADEYKNCFTISDKARNLAGSGLEALLMLAREKKIDLLGGQQA